MKKIYYSLACCLIGGMLASCGGGAKKSNATEEAAAPTTTAVSYSKSLKAPETDSLNLPIDAAYDPDEVIHLIFNDKKADGKKVTIVQVEEIGHAQLIDVDIETLRKYL